MQHETKRNETKRQQQQQQHKQTYHHHKPNCKFNRFKTQLKNEEEKVEGKKGVKIIMRIKRI